MPSGRASGTGHGYPQGADGEAGEGGTGAMGVWRYGLTSQPPTAHHSHWNPTSSIFIHVHRWPRHDHKRKQPRVRTLRQDVQFLTDIDFGTNKWSDWTVFLSGKGQTWMENACSASVLQWCENNQRSWFTSNTKVHWTRKRLQTSETPP